MALLYNAPLRSFVFFSYVFLTRGLVVVVVVAGVGIGNEGLGSSSGGCPEHFRTQGHSDQNVENHGLTNERSTVQLCTVYVVVS